MDFEWDSGHQEHNEKLVVDDEWDLVHQEYNAKLGVDFEWDLVRQEQNAELQNLDYLKQERRREI